MTRPCSRMKKRFTNAIFASRKITRSLPSASANSVSGLPDRKWRTTLKFRTAFRLPLNSRSRPKNRNCMICLMRMCKGKTRPHFRTWTSMIWRSCSSVPFPLPHSLWTSCSRRHPQDGIQGRSGERTGCR